MSDNIFPDLVLSSEFTKTPTFNTKILKSVNGRELRASYQATPIYEITLQIPVIDEKAGDLKIIEEFFIARRGAFDSFLFKMPWDDVYDCTFVGDGTASVFQLYKGLRPQFPLIYTEEKISPINPSMWNRNTLKNMWNSNTEKLMWSQGTASVNKKGQVVLSEPLEDGIDMNISGTYYYRCRFADDMQAFTLFSYRLWNGEVTLIGSLGNRI